MMLLCSVVAGCGDTGGDDFPSDTSTDVDAPGRGTVVISGDDPVTLMYHETVTIRGIYRDSGGLEAATDLEVALAGNAHDTSVSSTAVRSGTSGEFSFELTAGSVDAQFTLRVTAADLAVDEDEVTVTAPADTAPGIDGQYEGRRKIDFYRIVVLIDDGAVCDGLSGGVVTSLTTPDATLPVVADGLPSATALGVTMAGTWCPEGTVLPEDCEGWVFGCEDGVVLEAGTDSLTVTLEDDLTVFEAESFTVHHVLDTSALAAALASSVLVPLAEIVDDAGDPGLFLLDGIYERISADMGPTQADLFLGARLTSSLDAAVNTAVTTDLESDLYELGLALAAGLSSVELVGTLDGDFWGELDQEALLSLDRLIVAGVSIEASSMLVADPAADTLSVTYLHDEVSLHEHVLPVGAGEVVTGVLTMVILPSLPGPGVDADVVGMQEYLAHRVDCVTVGAVLAADADAGSIADATWYATACEQVVGMLAGAAIGGAAALDSVYPSLTMQGSCDFLGADMYPRSDSACAGFLTSAIWGEQVVEGSHTLRLDAVWLD